MKSRIFPSTFALLLVAGLLGPSVVAAHQEHDQVRPDEDETERRVMINVGPGDGHLWGVRRGGYLGVQLIELTPELRAHFGVDEATGVLVGSVEEESAAAAAGIRVGDILTRIDGDVVDRPRSVVRHLARREEGDSVSVELFRDGVYETVEAKVALGARPQLWLNALGEDSHFRMQWRTPDDQVFVLPSPDSEKIEVHREKLNEVMGTLHERLASPDFRARMLEFSSNTEELEDRIKELEQRLVELSAQLEKLLD